MSFPAPGFITRQDAEDLLSTKPAGTYLIRLSDCIWGYALSYRADAKCRHYLIDASDGNYRFFGTNRAMHRSLHDLVDCHKVIGSLSADCSVLLRLFSFIKNFFSRNLEGDASTNRVPWLWNTEFDVIVALKHSISQALGRRLSPFP